MRSEMREGTGSYAFFVLTKRMGEGIRVKNVTGDIAVLLGLRRNRQQLIRFSASAGAESIADQLEIKLAVDVELKDMKRL